MSTTEAKLPAAQPPQAVPAAAAPAEKASASAPPAIKRPAPSPGDFPLWLRDLAGGKNGRFFGITPEHVDLAAKPGFSSIPAPTMLDWVWNAVTLRHVWASPNTVWSLMALLMYFGCPYDLAPGSAAASAPLSTAFFLQRFPLWAAVTFGYTAFFHFGLYWGGWGERPFVPSRTYRVSKVLHNVLYSLSGVAIWVAFENVFAFLWATGRLPYLSDSAAYATPVGVASFLAGLALVPVWRDAHFYFAHRLLHYKPMYDQVHSLHHRNTDIEPFAGLCMHPVEHLYYYACILPSLVFFCSPFHFLWNGVHLLIAPGASHSGYEDHFQADAFHYMHHRYLECNYAGLGAAALDVHFGTFQERFTEAKADKTVEQRPDGKSTTLLAWDGEGGAAGLQLNLPTWHYSLYIALCAACLGAWGAVACNPALPAVRELFATPAARLALAVLAGFGPVWAAQLVALARGNEASLLAENAGTDGVGAKGGAKTVGLGGLQVSAAAFHVAIGTLFCSIPVTWMCYLAL